MVNSSQFCGLWFVDRFRLVIAVWDSVVAFLDVSKVPSVELGCDLVEDLTSSEIGKEELLEASSCLETSLVPWDLQKIPKWDVLILGHLDMWTCWFRLDLLVFPLGMEQKEQS